MFDWDTMTKLGMSSYWSESSQKMKTLGCQVGDDSIGKIILVKYLRLSEVFGFSIDPERLEWNQISCGIFHCKMH